MKLQSFNDLFVLLLSDIHFLEQQVVNLFPKLIDKAHSHELRNMLQEHLKETEKQLKKTEDIFNQINKSAKELHWENPLKELFSNAEHFLEINESSALLDAAIIAIVQKIEHVEIGTYGTLKAYAEAADLTEVKKYLKESVERHAREDTILTKLAEGTFFTSGINIEAARRI